MPSPRKPKQRKAAPPLPVLQSGSRGPAVALWRRFLDALDDAALRSGSGEEFDLALALATREFQRRQRGVAWVDGVVGPETWSAALATEGAALAPIKRAIRAIEIESDREMPPAKQRPLTSANREAWYGKPAFEPEPSPSDPDRVKLADSFAAAHLVRIAIPQLIGIPGAANDGGVVCHKAIADRVRRLFDAWEVAGLLPRVLSFDGMFVPRQRRTPDGAAASDQALSNHAWGLAFDINAGSNILGCPPARRGEEGCVYELVPIANECGFYWGGHFADRPDGMHFEIANVEPGAKG
ncbi:MAG: M15 family metallopeptidase [Alphaproteobacteria bacterium]|nr:M15 family metallopeptidase [Alphaproteobacteria bacterium]